MKDEEASSTRGWTKVLTTCSEPEAILVKGLLEGEGILCRMRSKAVPQFPVTVDGLAEISLYVVMEEHARAKEIINTLKRLDDKYEC